MKRLRTALAAVSLTLLGGTAHAVTYTFENIPSLDPSDHYGDAYEGNFWLDVTDLGGGEVLFQIESAVLAGVDYFIRTIFVDDTEPSSFTTLPTSNDANYSSGVVSMQYEIPNGNSNLPQGNNAGFSAVFSYESDNGQGNAYAIQQGETAGFVFGANFSDVIASLDSGDLIFGIHLQGIPGGHSDSYVTVAPVPVPAAGLMLFSAIGGLGLFARRRRKTA